MSTPHPTAKEEASTPLPGHIFVRYGTFPATGEVTLKVATDKRDGLDQPGRAGVISNGSNLEDMTFQVSADGHKFSGGIVLSAFGAGFPNFFRFEFDDGVLIHTIRLTGVSGESYGVVISPGRSPEGFVPYIIPPAEKPGPLRTTQPRGKLS